MKKQPNPPPSDKCPHKNVEFLGKQYNLYNSEYHDTYRCTDCGMSVVNLLINNKP